MLFILQSVNGPIVCDNYIIQSDKHICYLMNGCESKKKFEKTRHVKINDKAKKYILRGQRNARYHDRNPSKKDIL